MPVTVRQERAARRREAILTAAMDILAEEGVRALTHRSVAARAGLPPSSTGYYFPTIGELVEATFETYIERGIELLRAVESREYRPEQTDDEVLDLMARGLVAAPRAPQISILHLYLEAGSRPELQPIAERASEHFTGVAERILQMIGVDDPGDTPRAIWAYALGAFVTRLGHPHPETDAHAIRAGLAVVMADALRSRAPAGHRKS